MIDLLQECAGAARIGISGHVRPDGDCVGSCLALYLYLKKKLSDNVYLKVYLERPGEDLECLNLPGFDEIDSSFDAEEPFDVFFMLDCVEGRLGGAQKYFETAKKRINIDHHITNSGEGDVFYVVPEASSTCEVLYKLLDREAIDMYIAMALYTGIIHDSGVFQYSNTSPETMRIGADLIGFGFDFPQMIEKSFYERTYVQSQLLGRALMESIRFMDGQCIVSYIDQKTMDFYNATPKDLSGIVSHLRNIKGIHCAIFMYQTGVLEYKVSLRSDETVDVTEVVSHFGGGGHVRAAGCTMQGTFHDCVNNLSLHIAKQLAESVSK